MMLVINLKTYRQGAAVMKLVRKIKRYRPNSIVCAQPADIPAISKTGIKTYAQHVDYQESGKSTGFIVAEEIKSAGARGSLLNHSEHPVNMSTIKKTLQRCNKLNLKLIICAATLKKAAKIKKLRPWAIAFEDPKLVGTGRSITKYRSNDVEKFSKMLKGSKIIPLCGSGVNSAKDVAEAKKLGCKGVLVASAVARSPRPDKFLKESNG